MLNLCEERPQLTLNKALLTKNTKEIPIIYRNTFYKNLNILIDYSKGLIGEIIKKSGGVRVPMDTDYFERYLTGYKFDYIPFNKPSDKDLDGFWNIDPNDKSKVNIYYNANCSIKRQRYTKIHETIHFCQSIDKAFIGIFDDIANASILTTKIIYILLERATDKTTAMFLLPRQNFIEKFKIMPNIKELSNYYQVSELSVAYRLKECGLWELQKIPILIQ